MGSKPGEEDTAAKKIVTYDPVSDVYDIVVKYQTTYHYIYLPIDMFLTPIRFTVVFLVTQTKVQF